MAIPAIQPVRNENLKQMASGFGYRTDPFTKVRKMHNGMDFVTIPEHQYTLQEMVLSPELTIRHQGMGIILLSDTDLAMRVCMPI